MTRIVGIDPGQHTGVALIIAGKLCELATVHPLDIAEKLAQLSPARVVFEDSRLTSPTFDRKTSEAARRKIARNVGQVDGFCYLIVEACARLGIPAHGISPKGKGKKLNAEQFKAATGWAGTSNEHTRDGCMVAWPYRKAA